MTITIIPIIFFVSLFAHHQDKNNTWRDWVTLSFCLVYVFIVLLVHGDSIAQLGVFECYGFAIILLSYFLYSFRVPIRDAIPASRWVIGSGVVLFASFLWYFISWDGQDWYYIFGSFVPPGYTLPVLYLLYLDNCYSMGQLSNEIPAWAGAIGSGLSLVVIYGFGMLGHECLVVNMYLLTGAIFFYFCYYAYEDDPSVIKGWVSSAEILMGSILVFSFLVFLTVLSPSWVQQGWVFTIVAGLCLYAGYQEYESFSSVPLWVCPLASGVPLFNIGYVVHVLKDLSFLKGYVILSVFFFWGVEVYYQNVISGKVPAWVVSSLSGLFFGGVTFCAFFFGVGKCPVIGIYVLPGFFFLYFSYYGYIDEFSGVLTHWVSGSTDLPDSNVQDNDSNPNSINLNINEQEKQ